MSAKDETEITNSTEQTGHLKTPSSRSEDTVTASWIDGYTADEIAKLQHDDPSLCKIIDWLRESPTRPDRDTIELRHESPCTRNLYLLWKQLVWKGPDGVIIRKFNDLVFEVRMNQKGKSKTLHHDRLKPYASAKIPNWMKPLTKKLQASTSTTPGKQVNYADKSVQVEQKNIGRPGNAKGCKKKQASNSPKQLVQRKAQPTERELRSQCRRCAPRRFEDYDLSQIED